jgi:hypothetical protein
MPETRKILKVRVNRDCETGLKVFIQSNLDWSVFMNKEKGTFLLGGVKCFFPKESRLPNIPGQFRTDNEYEYDDFVNLSLLLAEDINKGVTYDFGILAVSDDKIASWIANLKQQAKILYFSYLKPIGIEVCFSTEMVEKVQSI